jgi:hypothetical protein
MADSGENAVHRRAGRASAVRAISAVPNWLTAIGLLFHNISFLNPV